jgi:Fur family peroxide stress response transcriptional regulator
MRQESEQQLKETFHLLCQKHGLRITPQRTAIFEELHRSGKHPTAEQLYLAVRQKYPHISLDTVNRTLLTFAKVGLIGIVEGYGSPRRYDPNLHSHHHAYCIRCGAILDFENERYDRLEIPEEIRKKFDIVSKRVILNGICENCREKQHT